MIFSRRWLGGANDACVYYFIVYFGAIVCVSVDLIVQTRAHLNSWLSIYNPAASIQRCVCVFVRRKRVIMNLILIFSAPFLLRSIFNPLAFFCVCDALKGSSERSKDWMKVDSKSKSLCSAHFNNGLRQIDWNHHQCRIYRSSISFKCLIFINQSSKTLLYVMPSDFKLHFFFLL